jgi:hypothetical protein
MNADRRCSQSTAVPEAGSGSFLPPQPYAVFTALIKSAATRRAPVSPDLRINFIIAVCCVSSLLLLLSGPEFISNQI